MHSPRATRIKAAAERRLASDLLDECEEVARDMVSAGIGRQLSAIERN